MNQSSPHPLGTLATLAAEAQEWHSCERGLGGTWAGLWLPSQQDSILATVAAQAQPLDETTRTMLARQAVLPGVRDYRSLYALLCTVSRVQGSPDLLLIQVVAGPSVANSLHPKAMEGKDTDRETA